MTRPDRQAIFPAMRLGQDVLADLALGLDKEWLITNGLGGSASGTVLGANTRRTHSLLMAAAPDGRLTNALLKLEERLHCGSQAFELGVHVHEDGQARPQGHLLLESFVLDPWPIWRIRAGDVLLEKSLFMVHGHNAVAVRYRHLDGPPGRLTVSPLVAMRDPLGVQTENADVRGAVQGVPGRIQIECTPERPRLTLWHSGAFLPARAWRRALAYVADAAAGAAPREDAFVPCYIEGELVPGGAIHLVASTEDQLFRALAVEGRLGTPPPGTLEGCVTRLEVAERLRLAEWREAALRGADFTARQAAAAHGGPEEDAARRSEPLVDAGDPWTAPLAMAVERGLARRGHRLAVATRLPLVEERGSLSLRAVPALIALRDFDAAREVLRGAVEYLDEGLAPMAFADDGRPLYGDPAPALWLVHAGELLARRSDDLELVRENLYPPLESVMQYYRSGTRFGIRVDQDGLLAAGQPASVRRVEANVLWYHALVAMAQLGRLIGRKESSAFYLAWAREHHKCFNERFWDDERGCLFNAVTADGPERGTSPEQLLAVSLAPALLPAERALRLVRTLEGDLFTPRGLRERGGSPRLLTAWLGPFYSAYLRAHQRAPEAQARVREWMAALRPELDRGACGYLPEAFGQPASPASVTAVAELLRAWIEDVDHAEQAVGVV
jgi:glycogen debranching enzyme